MRGSRRERMPAEAIQPYQRNGEASILLGGRVCRRCRKENTKGERWRRSIRIRWLAGMLFGLLLLAGASADAAKWSRHYIGQLPDSAFAAIETTPEGKKLRHLPHHDARGNLDIPHLCNALSRLDHVKCRDPDNAETARRHLREHLAEHGEKPCRPMRKNVR
jgi:hypothetical protein